MFRNRTGMPKAVTLLFMMLACGFYMTVQADSPATEGGGTIGTTYFYVAIDGSDNNPGTEEEPFATISRARDAVRAYKTLNPTGHITVWIRGGTYYIDETIVFGLEDSGNAEQTITYAAYPGEQPVIDSGVKLGEWTKVEGTLPHLPPSAAGRIWSAPIPVVNGEALPVKTLYLGELRLPRARGAGFAPTVSYPSQAAAFGPLEENKVTLEYPEGALRNWPNLDDIEILIRPAAAWTMQILPLQSVDAANNTAITKVPGM